MKRISLILLLFLFAAIPVFSQKKSPLVVVELFTSEGCSSCPAADELLKQMADVRASEGKPLIALAFHITYWNHLGWVDPFSQEMFTDRQKMYAAAFKQRQFYTPQAVMNGAHEFIGSDAKAFRDTLARVEKRKASFEIKAQARQQGDSIRVEYEVDSDSKNQIVNIALVEKNSERSVTRGENKNRTLKHFNVVREFKTSDLKKQEILLTKIKDIPIDNFEVVVYVQHKKSMRIGGAVKIAILE